MTNLIQAKLQYINLLEKELQRKQQRQNELAAAALKEGKHEEMGRKDVGESLSLETDIEALKNKINQAHSDLGSYQ